MCIWIGGKTAARIPGMMEVLCRIPTVLVSEGRSSPTRGPSFQKSRLTSKIRQRVENISAVTHMIGNDAHNLRTPSKRDRDLAMHEAFHSRQQG